MRSPCLTLRQPVAVPAATQQSKTIKRQCSLPIHLNTLLLLEPNKQPEPVGLGQPPSLDRSGTFSLFDLELDVAKDGSANGGPVPPGPGSSNGRIAHLKAGAGMDRSFSDLELYRELSLGQRSGTASFLQLLGNILSLCRPATELETLVAQQLRQLRSKNSCNTDIEDLAADLVSRGLLVHVQDGADSPGAAPAAPQRNCLRSLRHSFMVCSGYHITGQPDPVLLPDLLLVEPCFKEQFLIANPTPEYAQLLGALPVSFVGTMDRLTKVVGLMAKQVAAAFKQQQLPLPPWRTEEAMLSKWNPPQMQDVARVVQQRARSTPNAATITTAPAPPALSAATQGGGAGGEEAGAARSQHFHPHLGSLVRGMSRQLSVSMNGGTAMGIPTGPSPGAVNQRGEEAGWGRMTESHSQAPRHQGAPRTPNRAPAAAATRIGKIAAAAAAAGGEEGGAGPGADVAAPSLSSVAPLQLQLQAVDEHLAVGGDEALLSPFLAAAAQAQRGGGPRGEDIGFGAGTTTFAAIAEAGRQGSDARRRSLLGLHRGDKAMEQPCVQGPPPPASTAGARGAGAQVGDGVGEGGAARTRAALLTSPLKFTRQNSVDLIAAVRRERACMRSALAAALKPPEAGGAIGPVTAPTQPTCQPQPFVAVGAISATQQPVCAAMVAPQQQQQQQPAVQVMPPPAFLLANQGLHRQSAPDGCPPAPAGGGGGGVGDVFAAGPEAALPNLRHVSDTQGSGARPAFRTAQNAGAGVHPLPRKLHPPPPPQQAAQAARVQPRQPPAPKVYAPVQVVAESNAWPGWPRILTVKWGAALNHGGNINPPTSNATRSSNWQAAV